MAFFWKNGGRNLRYLFCDPPNSTSLRGTASFHVCVKIGARVSAIAFLKNPQKVFLSRVTLCRGAWLKSRMRGTETPEPIWKKFCVVVGIRDVVTQTNFGDHRLRGFCVAKVKFPPFPIDFHRRPYIHALLCECVNHASILHRHEISLKGPI